MLVDGYSCQRERPWQGVLAQCAMTHAHLGVTPSLLLLLLCLSRLEGVLGLFEIEPHSSSVPPLRGARGLAKARRSQNVRRLVSCVGCTGFTSQTWTHLQGIGIFRHCKSCRVGRRRLRAWRTQVQPFLHEPFVGTAEAGSAVHQPRCLCLCSRTKCARTCRRVYVVND